MVLKCIYFIWFDCKKFGVKRLPKSILKKWLTYSEATQACSLIVLITSMNLIRLVNVCPWYIMGIVSGPSQQSTKMKYNIIIQMKIIFITTKTMLLIFCSMTYVQYTCTPSVSTSHMLHKKNRWKPDHRLNNWNKIKTTMNIYG